MITIINEIWSGLNEIIGVAGSATTLYDHFKNTNLAQTDSCLMLIRTKSKLAYDRYREYRKRRHNDIGEPIESDVLDYWESCLKRNILPSARDLVSQKIASIEEAEILIDYLLEAWLGVPEFVEWLNSQLINLKLESIAAQLLNLSSISENLSCLMQYVPITGELITPSIINDAKYSCTDLDIEHYYMVDSNFNTMIRVISADHDIPNLSACEKISHIIREGSPIIIAGNSGSGKTSIMLRAALQWVKDGNMAVWLSLSNRDTITFPQAKAFFNRLLQAVSGDQKILLCIDNPYEGRASLINLQNAWPVNSNNIQLIMAERKRKLTLLADSDEDFLFRWFDNAKLVVLQGLKETAIKYHLKDYTGFAYPETLYRRTAVLEKCTGILVTKGVVSQDKKDECVKRVLEKADTNVSLAELIYRTLFEFNEDISKLNVKLDWNEWSSFLEEKMGIKEAMRPYGVIAAFKIFNMPMPISLFCRFFSLDESLFCASLDEWMITNQIEPVIYRKDYSTLQPKHDIIAELFFLFNHKKIFINELMISLLNAMNRNEVEWFLDNIIDKKEMKHKKKDIGDIAYRKYMNVIFQKIQQHEYALSSTGRANLCLGYLWSRTQNERENPVELNNVLSTLIPPIEDILPITKVYTEWGIWARETGNIALAEEKFQCVIDNCSNRIPAQTEMGRLLSKQKGRELEAEQYLLRSIMINSRHLHSRTELGKLLAKQSGREKEAEEHLREAIAINPKHLHSRIELGKLLALQKGREGEAEQCLLEVLELDPNNLHAHTELGRLFTQQKGCEKEAEAYFRKAMNINPNHLHSRTELGMLLATQEGHEGEAEQCFRDAFHIDPKHLHSRIELGRLLANQSGREEEAIECFHQVISIDPGNFYAHYELGVFWEKQQGHEREAEFYLNKAAQIDLDRFNCLRMQ